MNNDTLIEKINYECPFCDNLHSIEIHKRITKALVKDTVVEYEQTYYYCPIEDEEFTPDKILDQNLLKARDAYRKQKGLLTSEQIKKYRNNYGLNQVEFSNLLGWGDVTIQRYEKKLIQDETYDQLIRLVGEDPAFALNQLDKHRNNFQEDRYNQIRNILKNQIREKKNLSLIIQSIKNIYIQYEEESELNGYKKIDIDKIANILAFFAKYNDPLYKVRLMKLLWYTDALHFKKYNKSITGLVYCHLPLGAVPEAHEEILRLPSIKVEEEQVTDNGAWYRIYPTKEVNLNLFSTSELEILTTVSNYFKNMTGRQISDYMHREKAYIKTEKYQLISYSFAKELKDFN
ncbi:MAG TPA: DUF4065 domain-containing protein [Bacillota bacterium]|nr:DUF4065 domain-containing protein [Bacillota bacterium]